MYTLPDLGYQTQKQLLRSRSFQKMIGIYRGIVEKTNDQYKLGYVKVRIPCLHSNAVLPQDLPIAYVMQPYGGGQNYGQFYIPPVGSTVFVQFEDGNPEVPIVVGCWYADVMNIDEKETEEVPKSVKNCQITHTQLKGKATIQVLQKTQEKNPYDSVDSTIKEYRYEPRNLIVKSFKGHVFELDDTGVSDVGSADDGQSTVHNEGIRLTTRRGQIIHIVDEPNRECILIKTSDERLPDGTLVPGNYIQIDHVKKNINIWAINNLQTEIYNDAVTHVAQNELKVVDKNVITEIGLSKTETVGSNWTVDVTGNIIITAKGQCTINTGGPTVVNSGGNANVTSNGIISVTAKQIHLNP